MRQFVLRNKIEVTQMVLNRYGGVSGMRLKSSFNLFAILLFIFWGSIGFQIIILAALFHPGRTYGGSSRRRTKPYDLRVDFPLALPKYLSENLYFVAG